MEPAPAWFADACARPSSPGEVEVSGARVRYLVWEPVVDVGEPTLLLLHGTAAHARWWVHVAGLLCEDRRVVAVDLSGHGGSSHRDTYNVERWADEVVAVARAVDPDGDGVGIVGHSLGGSVAAVAAARATVALHGIALCETVRDPRGPHDERIPSRPRPYFATRREALSRFRLVPAQPQSLPFVVDHVARHSVAHDEEGWTWKYDTRIAEVLRQTMPLTDDLVRAVMVPMTLIWSEHGLVSRADAHALAVEAGGSATTVELPAAGHHPMLDQPLALAAVIRAIAANWRGAPV